MDRQQKSWALAQPKKDLTKTNINADLVKSIKCKAVEELGRV